MQLPTSHLSGEVQGPVKDWAKALPTYGMATHRGHVLPSAPQWWVMESSSWGVKLNRNYQNTSQVGRTRIVSRNVHCVHVYARTGKCTFLWAALLKGAESCSAQHA